MKEKAYNGFIRWLNGFLDFILNCKRRDKNV